jgi:uncharacterized protein YndB with AHSA1/START domain
VTDLHIDVDLPHPPARIWRALTDRRLLGEWWLPTDLEAVAGESFRAFPPPGTPGMPAALDIDVLQVDEPTVLVQRWSGDDLHTQVSWEIAERAGGSRLRFTQNGFFGLDGTRRRRELRRSYDAMLRDRLPAVLDRLASGSVDLRSAVVDAHPVIRRRPGGPGAQALPVEPAASVPEAGAGPAGRPDRRVRLLALISAVVLVVLAGSAIAVLTRGGPVRGSGAPATEPGHDLGAGPQGGLPTDGSRGTPAGSPAPAGGDPSATATPGSTAGTGPVTEATAVPGAAPLTAGYRTLALLGLGGFDTEVTVRNPGGADRQGWTVVLVMPDATVVENRSSSLVTLSQQGAVVTITPRAGSVLAAGASTTFTVRFPALLALGKAVTSCTVDGVACTAG